MRCAVLHRWVVVWSLTTLLYGAQAAFASEPASPADPAPHRDAAPVDVPAPPSAIPHIGLLLPAASSVFARAGEAVRSGFAASAKAAGTALPIRDYRAADDGESVVARYREAVLAGARLVIGPLTRSGVAALATSRLVGVPTLALNVPERGMSLPRNLYVLSLHIEAEARQVAQLAAKEGRRTAFTIAGDTSLLRRIHQAFVEEFSQLGGNVIADYRFTSDPSALARLRQAVGFETPDMVFLALDFQRARMVRPYLGAVVIYATSQVHPGQMNPLAGFDLSGVRFLDMPWLLQPDHPAVMVYPRRDFRDALDLERLYALGIDAFRIGSALLQGRAALPLDGVTGNLTLGRDQHFVRELTGAQFADGKLTLFAGKQ